MVQVRRHARSRSACFEKALCYRVETEGEPEMTSLAEKLTEAFGEEMDLERFVKKKLD